MLWKFLATVVDFYFTKAAGLLRATLQKQGYTPRIFQRIFQKFQISFPVEYLSITDF